MFKIIMFVRKKQHLSTEEFIKLWEAHSQKVTQICRYGKLCNVARY